MDRCADTAVSIIVPIYNVQEYLRQCLDSAIGQSLQSIEIVCVNDGSTDSSQDIVDEYASHDPRIVVVEKENGGPSSARNAGMDIACGKYILFLDADDFIDIELCARTYEKAEASDTDLVFYNAVLFSNGRKLSRNFFVYPDIDGIFCPCDYPLVMTQVSPCNRLYRADLMKNLRFKEGILYEDQPFSAEVNIVARRAVIIDYPLYFYRKENPVSITTSLSTSMGIFDSFDYLKQVLKLYDKKELYDSVYSAEELVNYKNRFHLLPINQRSAFFEKARKRLSNVDWPNLLANCKEYDAKYWPWSLSDKYFTVCLRRTGYWAYALIWLKNDWRQLKDIIFNLPIVGKLFEWVWAICCLPLLYEKMIERQYFGDDSD